MRRFAGKLAFVHRTLWQRETAYRWAALLGPPPVIGAGLAALCLTVFPRVWPGVEHPGGGAPWAHRQSPAPHSDAPLQEATLPLPARDADGQFHGFRPGWRGEIHPVSIDATRDVDVGAPVLASFTLDQADIPLQRVVDAGPPGGLFAVSAASFFVVRTPGLYAFSVRLARSGTQSADCVVRLNSRHHHMVRNVNLGTGGNAAMDFAVTQFRLEAGLFGMAMGGGCWRGDHVLGDGDLTVLVRGPGEIGLRPAASGELIRQAQ